MFERKLNLNEEQARRWVKAHLSQTEGYTLHHGFWSRHGARLTVPIFRRDEGHAVGPVGQIHFELVPEDQTHTLLRAHADTPTARRFLEQMMGDSEVRTGKRGASHPTLKTRERAKLYKRLKDAHPDWAQFKVAMDANRQENVDYHTRDTVRNAYGAMGWKWERADRIR